MMSRSRPGQLAAQSLFRSPRAGASPKCSIPFQVSRCLSQTAPRRDESKPTAKTVAPRRKATESLLENIYGSSQAGKAQPQSNAMANLSQSVVFQTLNKSSIDTSALSGKAMPATAVKQKDDDYEPFHFHVMSHKHNTHITVSRPNRDPIISMSCGNIGYKKSRRGLFDSAYSLTKYVLERLVHMGWQMKINRLELVLRGFGQGRDAAVKVLMSPEGRVLRDKIVRVSDSTRIKFAGTRSKKPRRI